MRGTRKGGLGLILLLTQVVVTIAALAWVPSNPAKLAVMATIWALGFRWITADELMLMLALDVLYCFMDLVALDRGSFRFLHPDFMGMPCYEYLMWGFYGLHTIRLLPRGTPGGSLALAIVVAVLFAVPFAAFADPGRLLVASAVPFALALALYHERLDFAYVAYMMLMGTLVEFTGVWTGQWTYPGAGPGVVPAWYLVLWGGSGLLLRRLGLPLLERWTHRAGARC